jgi:hypothetical protein
MIVLPTVFVEVKAVDTEVSPVADPEDVIDCTSEITAGLIVRLSAWVVVAELASVTRTVKALVAATLGVPEIMPVAGASVSPVGRVPVEMDQVLGAVPPVAASVVV